jgi:hypothetical protein
MAIQTGIQHITVGSQAEHDTVLQRFEDQHYHVDLTTSNETQLVRDRFVISQDLPPTLILTLCFAVPGIAYYCYLLVRPLPRVIITIKS